MDAAVDERQHGPAPVVVLEEIATAFGMPASQLLDEPATKSEPDCHLSSVSMRQLLMDLLILTAFARIAPP